MLSSKVFLNKIRETKDLCTNRAKFTFEELMIGTHLFGVVITHMPIVVIARKRRQHLRINPAITTPQYNISGGR